MFCQDQWKMVKSSFIIVLGSLNFYSKVFSEIAKPTTSYLFACCLHIDFVDIRRGALKAMQKAFYCYQDDSCHQPENRSRWSLDEVIHLLGYDDQDQLLEALEYYEIPFDLNHGILFGRIIDHITNRPLRGVFNGIFFYIIINKRTAESN